MNELDLINAIDYFKSIDYTRGLRRERIATAVFAAAMSHARVSTPADLADASVRAADLLINALDRRDL